MTLQKNIWTFIGMLVIGAIIGSLLGELIGVLFSGTAQKFFTKGVELGLKSFTVDLRIAELTLGFTFKFSVLSLLGIFAGGYFYQKYI